MQMIFQNASMSFNPRRKIRTSMDENLRFLAGIPGRERRRETMEQYMEMVELKPELLQRYPGELSEGQCQRAAIARALMTQPKMLLCDEITSALDVIVQDKIMELLEKLADRLNVSILFISHDLALVSGFCDRIMVMKEGICVEEEHWNSKRNYWTDKVCEKRTYNKDFCHCPGKHNVYCAGICDGKNGEYHIWRRAISGYHEIRWNSFFMCMYSDRNDVLSGKI